MSKSKMIFVALASATIQMLSTPSGHAALGSYYYDGKSPSSTGCNNDAYTVYTRYAGSARLLLRYSPRCRTVWAHILDAATRTANNQGGSARVHRDQDGAAISCASAWGGTGCYTNMLYDGGLTSHAHGSNDTGFTIYYADTPSY